MAKTQVRTGQLEDEGVARADLNVSTSGKAVIRKTIDGTGISSTATGADSGTGDVTINTTNATREFSIVFSKAGTLAVATGTHRWYADKTYTIAQVRASVGTAPTGASLIVDVNKNGTTIFTTQSNRPTIAASGFTDLADAIDVSSIASGDYFTVDIDQIGSTIPGSDLTVQILLRSG